MDEAGGVSEIKETIVDVGKLKEVAIADDHEIPSTEKIWDFSPHQRYFDIVERSFKDLDEYSSSSQEVAGGGGAGCTGFYRVPDDMRRRAGNENLYDPKYVDFWKIKDLFEKDDDEDDRRRRSQLRHYCYHLRSFAEQDGENVESLMRRLYERREQMPKQWYPDHDDQEEPYFINGAASNLWVLLMGSCFLRDLFIRYFWNELSAKEDPECGHLWVSELWADLLLLENQIPNFRDKPLYGYVGLTPYFSDFLPLNILNAEDSLEQLFLYGDQYTPYYHQHVLHCVHHRLLPTAINHEAGNYLASLGGLCWRSPNGLSSRKSLSTMKPVPTATRLRQAGIKFKAVDKEGFVVEFKRGVLKLPRLHITKSTKKVLMNLIAWEKCHREAPKYIINFAIFMDYLINTSKDVETLIQSTVFEHSLATDEEVAALFSGFCQDLIYTRDENGYDIFPKLCVDINNYCRSRPNMWWANLMQEYFKSPWTIISLIAALFLILVTTAQTFFSAYSYFRPPN